MNAYEHTEIIGVDSDQSDVQVSFKCKELGSREYHVTVYGTVYMNTIIEEGDHLHPTFTDSEVKDIDVTLYTITDVEGDPVHITLTPFDEDFLKDQIIEHCI